MKKFFKKNFKIILSFLIGVIVTSSIGYAVAGTIGSNEVTYTGNGQTTAEGALNDLYNKASKCTTQLKYRYWNDNWSGTTYQKNAVPTRTYTSREAFASAYSSFASDPRYIRTTIIDGTIEVHEACIYYNNREFCIAPYYWAGKIETKDATVGTNTKIKLQRDMEAALGTTASSCYSYGDSAGCYFGSFRCRAYYDGGVECSGVGSCYVLSDGSAGCE